MIATPSSKCASESPEKDKTNLSTTANSNSKYNSTNSLNFSNNKFNSYANSNYDLYERTSAASATLSGSVENRKNFMGIVLDFDSSISAANAEQEFDGLLHRDHSSAVQTLKMLNVLRKNRQLCDLILQLDDDSEDIYCHKIILASNSKFFMEIFTDYEIEQTNSVKIDPTLSDADTERNNPKTKLSNGNLNGLTNSYNYNLKRKSVQAILNANHTGPHGQLVFCLSGYLKNYLNETHNHHNAKLSTITNHNSHHHHYYTHHNGNDGSVSAQNENSHHMNQNFDSEALKLCIDYLYTSQLKVPSYLLPHVYTLAYHLSFDSIVQVCAQYLTRHLNVDNCLSIRSFALDENLIESSTQCIEKNIEYILQLTPNVNNKPAKTNENLSASSSLSSSLSSFSTINNTTSNKQAQISNNNKDLSVSTSSLSSSINLANKEFNHLPRINIELVGLSQPKTKLPDNMPYLTQLCMNYLVNELIEKHGNIHSLNDLCDNLSMLYMNRIDHTLHDCTDMDSSDKNFSDYINDYQKQHSIYSHDADGVSCNGRRNSGNNNNNNNIHTHSPTQSINTPNGTCRLKTFKITDQELNTFGTATPIRFKVLHDNEAICTHQTSENSFIAICTLTSKLVTLSVHILSQQQHMKKHEMEMSVEEGSYLQGIVDSGILAAKLEGQNSEESDGLSSISQQNSLDSNNQDMGRLSLEPESQFSMDQQINKGQIKIKRNLSIHSGSTESERLPKMNVARCSHGLVPFDNKLYIIGGYDRGECLKVCEIYDPKTNVMQDIPQMESRRGRAAITWFDKQKSIYVLGGSDGHEDLNSLECLNMDTNEWSSIKFEFELGCTNLGAIACDKFIYMVGLKSDGGKSLSRTSCIKYEPSTNNFSRIADLNHGRSQSALVWTSAKSKSPGDSENIEDYFLYVFGGHDQIRCLSSCEVYSVKENKWKVIANMHDPRRGCGAALHSKSQKVYIVGGTNGSQSLKSVEIYDIQEKRWTTGPELNLARTNVAIAFIGDILFAVGGFDGKSFLKTIEYLNVNNINSGWSMYHKLADFDFLHQDEAL